MSTARTEHRCSEILSLKSHVWRLSRRPKAARRADTGHLRRSLCIESLENRQLLACNVFSNDGTVFIRGDNQDQTVEIEVAGGGNVSVECDGETQSLAGVDRVFASLRGGNDDLSVEFSPEIGDDVILGLWASLGSGDDELTYLPPLGTSKLDFRARIKAGAGNDLLNISAGTVADKFDIQVDGGAGDDVFSYVAPIGSSRLDFRGGPGDDVFSYVAPIGSSRLDLQADVFGGPGNDEINFLVQGLVEGSVRASLDGGDGNDSINAVVVVDPASSGQVEVAVLGRGGNDWLRLVALDERVAGSRYGINGGDGFDVCESTPNVHTVNCETSMSLILT